MGRLTRTESQARTHKDLVETARDLFLADGYSKTSLEKVAEVAGYSKGAVYSNFKNKKVLCLEVLALIHETKVAELTDLLAAPETLDRRIELVRGWAERSLGDLEWTMLEFEFFVLARDDEELREALVGVLGTARAMALQLLHSTTAGLGIDIPMPEADIATTIIGLGLGLGIQRAIDPTISLDYLTNGVGALLTASVGVGTGS